MQIIETLKSNTKIETTQSQYENEIAEILFKLNTYKDFAILDEGPSQEDLRKRLAKLRSYINCLN